MQASLCVFLIKPFIYSDSIANCDRNINAHKNIFLIFLCKMLIEEVEIVSAFVEKANEPLTRRMDSGNCVEDEGKRQFLFLGEAHVEMEYNRSSMQPFKSMA